MLYLIVLCIVLSLVTCENIPYNDHILEALHPEYLKIPKFSKFDAPNWSPGNGDSYIDLSHLKLYSSCSDPQLEPFFHPDNNLANCPTSILDLIIFNEPSDKPWMDYWTDHEFCCTDELVIAGYCSEKNKIILPSNLPEAFVHSFQVKPDVKTSLDSMDLVHYEISKTGVVILLMAECNPNLPAIKITGSIESKDPYGFLPADLYVNLPFFGALSICYTIIGVAWLILCGMYYSQLMNLQTWISAVLALGMIEATIMYSHYLHWNDLGTANKGLLMFGLFFGVSKRAVCRVLVTLVALGYGVVRPTIGEDMNRVVYLGLIYVVLSLIYTITIHSPSSSKVAGDPEYDLLSLVVFALASIDTLFYIWIITSINNLLTTLAGRRQAIKYILYKNFRNVLFISVFFTCVWFLYGSSINMNESYGNDNSWQYKWTIDALWEVTYFGLFVTIAVMWAPTQNSQRYAHSIELTQLEDDNDWMGAGDSIDSPGDDVDDEYGGRLNDEDDPFQGQGALDHVTALAKKN